MNKSKRDCAPSNIFAPAGYATRVTRFLYLGMRRPIITLNVFNLVSELELFVLTSVITF